MCASNTAAPPHFWENRSSLYCCITYATPYNEPDRILVWIHVPEGSPKRV